MAGIATRNVSGMTQEKMMSDALTDLRKFPSWWNGATTDTKRSMVIISRLIILTPRGVPDNNRIIVMTTPVGAHQCRIAMIAHGSEFTLCPRSTLHYTLETYQKLQHRSETSAIYVSRYVVSNVHVFLLYRLQKSRADRAELDNS